MDALYDVIIVGGGVVGCFIARALSRYKLRVLLLERESDVCSGTSKANTAIVHAGYDAKPGTLKAALNLVGNRAYDQVCAELDVPFQRCGTYVVALTDDDLRTLDDLYRRGVQNGVTGMRIISGEEMRRIEPLVNPETRGALYAATGGIVDPFLLTIAAAENAVLNGVHLRLETEVTDLIRQNGRIAGVKTNQGQIFGRFVINAAGLHADQLMAKAGLQGFTITPRKGEYYVFDREKSRVHAVLFPCPTPISKGILVTPTTHGNTLIGPNAVDISNKEDLSVTPQGLEEVFAGAQRLVPTLDRRDVIAVFAGLRASGSTGDFLIEAPAQAPGLINVAGIESPGLTAAPAIAEFVVQLLRECGLKLVEKPDYNPIRRAPPRFSELSRQEQALLIAKDARYGRIVCRCETVTEGEIVAAIHAPVPARTYDALKRRTRLGAGRCQGGFDTPRVIHVLARELGLPPTAITKKGPGSEFVVRETKDWNDDAKV
ncbi:MAG: NAD(P)/FAD-dependent oxidoreductase [Chloroflexi bacterium]|nr:NAD(P)/FAD-dependent oxidoreductase [Chloroflexota bacterium]